MQWPRTLTRGLETAATILLVMGAAFNLQKFPGFRGTTYHVQLADASGLHKGNMVQIAGIRVGQGTPADKQQTWQAVTRAAPSSSTSGASPGTAGGPGPA